MNYKLAHHYLLLLNLIRKPLLCSSPTDSVCYCLLSGTSSYGSQGYGGEGKLYSLESGPEKPQDKKKKSSGLATLRRRFIKRRKSSRSADHVRQMRELLSGWDVRDANALVEEYEGTAALKELNLQAGLARAEARSLHRDLAALYQHKYCTDVDLIFQDACFPAHRAVLAARCPFFKTLLSSSPGYGAEVLLDVGTAGMDAAMFSALLHYLYTGELGPEVDARLRNMDVLVRLSEEFGTPSSLEEDMHGLCEHMCFYDSLLSFSSDSELVEVFSAGPAVGVAAGGGGGPVIQGPADEELRAHKAVLSARSPFFRNLLQRRIRTGEEITERALQTPTRIILDESIIPKKYARVILHCMYTDAVELALVLRGSPSAGSLGEVQALVAGGRGVASRAEEAMELYHIALFLEFSMLAQGESRSPDLLPYVSCSLTSPFVYLMNSQAFFRGRIGGLGTGEGAAVVALHAVINVVKEFPVALKSDVSTFLPLWLLLEPVEIQLFFREEGVQSFNMSRRCNLSGRCCCLCFF